jgi:hypothetical protein
MKKRLSYDENGIPILSRTEIEERAAVFLEFFDPECLKRPQLTPLGQICETLKTNHGVGFVFNVDLGHSADGRTP